MRSGILCNYVYRKSRHLERYCHFKGAQVLQCALKMLCSCVYNAWRTCHFHKQIAEVELHELELTSFRMTQERQSKASIAAYRCWKQIIIYKLIELLRVWNIRQAQPHTVWTQKNKSFSKHGDWPCVIPSFSKKELHTHIYLLLPQQKLCLEELLSCMRYK